MPGNRAHETQNQRTLLFGTHGNVAAVEERQPCLRHRWQRIDGHHVGLQADVSGSGELSSQGVHGTHRRVPVHPYHEENGQIEPSPGQISQRSEEIRVAVLPQARFEMAALLGGKNGQQALVRSVSPLHPDGKAEAPVLNVVRAVNRVEPGRGGDSALSQRPLQPKGGLSQNGVVRRQNLAGAQRHGTGGIEIHLHRIAQVDPLVTGIHAVVRQPLRTGTTKIQVALAPKVRFGCKPVFQHGDAGGQICRKSNAIEIAVAGLFSLRTLGQVHPAHAAVIHKHRSELNAGTVFVEADGLNAFLESGHLAAHHNFAEQGIPVGSDLTRLVAGKVLFAGGNETPGGFGARPLF